MKIEKEKFGHALIPKEITNSSGATEVCITISGIPHLKFTKKTYRGLQSWYESKHDFRIEIYLDGATMLLEYNSPEKWKTVLDIINQEV